MGEPLVVREAGFSRGSRTIFQGLSLTARAGDIVCILGPNGCGKTTLLQCIAGILPLAQGCVLLDGHDVKALTARDIARRVSVVFQDHWPVFPYTVRDVVVMGRTPHLAWFEGPRVGDFEKCREVLVGIGIQDLIDRPYTGLSGGERQLVMIARALAQETEVLLLDEVTAHLDFHNEARVLRVIHDLARSRQLTIVLTTHSPNQALLVGTTVALMKDGGFIASGRPEDVVTPVNLKTLYDAEVRLVPLVDRVGHAQTVVVPVLWPESDTTTTWTGSRQS